MPIIAVITKLARFVTLRPNQFISVMANGVGGYMERSAYSRKLYTNCITTLSGFCCCC
jgi:hypothetical protein